jgi:hypothetical protein
MSEATKRRANQVLSAATSLSDRCRTARRTRSESRDLAPHLPFLRRHATALTCSQSTGDAYVRATIYAFLAGDQGLVDQASSRVGLYRLFHAIWATTSARVLENDGRIDGTGPQLLGAAKRAFLLLTRMEAFSPDEVALITAQPMKTARRIVGDAARGASYSHRHIERA